MNPHVHVCFVSLAHRAQTDMFRNLAKTKILGNKQTSQLVSREGEGGGVILFLRFHIQCF